MALRHSARLEFKLMIEKIQRGDTVLVDGSERCTVERTGMYAGGTRTATRLEGVTVRPVEGGRARVVAVRRCKKITLSGDVESDA